MQDWCDYLDDNLLQSANNIPWKKKKICILFNSYLLTLLGKHYKLNLLNSIMLLFFLIFILPINGELVNDKGKYFNYSPNQKTTQSNEVGKNKINAFITGNIKQDDFVNTDIINHKSRKSSDQHDLLTLSDILKELSITTPCNRTLSSKILQKIINESLTGDLRYKILWISQTVAIHPHLYTKEVPLNATLTSYSIFNSKQTGYDVYLESGYGKSGTRRPNPTFGLYLKCDPEPNWEAVVVYPTSKDNKYLHATLPLRKLDSCGLSSECYSNKCSFTSYGSLKFYARDCCSETKSFCRSEVSRITSMWFVLNLICVITCLCLIPVIILERRRQRHEARGWALMEIFLIGAAILYTIVLIDKVNFESSSCAYAIWLRQIGFSTFYGAIVLKIYRNLQEYRVRKAHHVFVKEVDLFKYLCCFLLLTTTGLLAWTFGSWTDEKLWKAIWPQCHLQTWTLIWHAYELAFLIYALRLCYKARNSSWMERWQFTLAIVFETIVTIIANLLRYAYRKTADSEMLLTITFVQLQLTVTINIIIIMAPKFYSVTSETNRRTLTMSGSSGRAHPSLAKLRDNLINGTIDFAEIPIVDMNPEDIRAELKRVYTQLRMYKLKNLYQDNPHISKRKGGKKSTDKVSKIRRISLPQSSSSPKCVKKIEDDEEERSDYTVESAPHNVYLSATKKLNLEPDLSVRV